MVWKKPEYSKTQIINAGKTIRHASERSFQDVVEAREIVDNWRASHAYPLKVFYFFLKRKFEGRDYVIAQRLKRLTSIVNELNREPNMSLWTMQDLGGCRVVVPSIADVYEVVDLVKASHIRHILKKEYDYIRSPKRSGYRSYHMVYKFHSASKDTYNRNMLIEIQVRTRLQHMWATAVETMGIFTDQALKASSGDDDTLQFFAAASSLFALNEGCPVVDGCDSDAKSLACRIIAMDKEHNYFDKLLACRLSMQRIEGETPKKKESYYLLRLDYSKRQLIIRPFYDIDFATESYNDAEARLNSNIDVVLVSSASFAMLKKAYPNYFSDIQMFVTTLRRMVADALDEPRTSGGSFVLK